VAGGREFDGPKFKELILYLADQSGEDEGFGATKLNKLLYFADFEAYRRLGTSITGATYQKLPWGPAAWEFVPLHGELLKDQWAHVERRERGGYEQHVTKSTGADTSFFSPEELGVVNDVLDQLRPLDATGSSEYAHQKSAGWNIVPLGQVIPYGTSIICTDPIDDEVITYFQRLEGISAA
jgi:hypothetical protein